MARTINLAWGDDEAVFDLTPIDRSRVYGRRRRIAYDESGRPCVRASLLDDGSLVLRPGMTGQGYFAPDGTWVPQSELESVHSDGAAAEPVTSTLGVTVEAEGPVSPEAVLDLAMRSIYWLTPIACPASLREALDSGSLFTFPFAYRDGFQRHRAVLLSNDEGLWALVGDPMDRQWSELGQAVALSEPSVESVDELTFEML